VIWGWRKKEFFPTCFEKSEVAVAMANADLCGAKRQLFGNEAYSTKIMEFMSLGVPVGNIQHEGRPLLLRLFRNRFSTKRRSLRGIEGVDPRTGNRRPGPRYAERQLAAP
jgi:hypothetical protein